MSGIVKKMKLSFKILKNIDLVYEYLTDMKKFVSVHPVISQINNISDESYIVHETLKFGPIPFSFSYPVTIEKDAAKKKIIIRAKVYKMTKIEMQFVLKSENNYTIIEEEIEFKSLLPIESLMQRIFKEQHMQLFKNIEAVK